jgi:hypothetical protein
MGSSGMTLWKNSICVSPGWAHARLSDASCSRLRRNGPSQKLARGFLGLGPGLQTLFIVGISVRHSYMPCLQAVVINVASSDTYPSSLIRYMTSLTPSCLSASHLV